MMKRQNGLFSRRINSETHAFRLVKMVLAGMLLLSVSSCVAQQADLIRLQRDFEAKVIKLDQEKKNLATILSQANQAIEASQQVLAKQKAEVSELVKARAQIKSELRSLREENLTQLSGELATESHRLQRLRQAMEGITQEVNILKADLKARDQARADQISTLGTDVKKGYDQQTTLHTTITGFRASFVEFKDALSGIKKQVSAEQTRAMTAETKMKDDFEAQQAALYGKLGSDTNTLKQYLENEVNPSIRSVAKTIQEVNASFSRQLDEQRAELTHHMTILAELNDRVGTELASLKQQDEGTHHNLENLTQSMAQLRSGLDTVGVQLGEKVDEHAHIFEQVDGHLKQLENQYAVLSEKLDADTQALRGYLDNDIRTSLESLSKAVETEKVRSLQFSKTLKGFIQTLEQTTKADVKQVQAQVATQETHVQDLRQSVVSMREVLDSMTGMLGNRSDHQMQQIWKLAEEFDQMEQAQSMESSRLDTNAKALSSYLDEVVTSVQAVVDTFDQVKISLSSRLDTQANHLAEQERRLTETDNRSLLSQQVNQELQANVQHLNQLTTAVEQIKEVVNTIGTTLGQTIDNHEEQLTSLAQHVQQLRSSFPPSSSPSLPPPSPSQSPGPASAP